MNKSRLGIAGAITAIGLAAIALVGKFEGYKPYAYRDVIGVWTACYGSTKGIKAGMKFTKEQCDVMFLGDLQTHEAGMRACLKAPDAIPSKSYVAFLSLTYNIGVGGFCRSSVAANINMGNLTNACHRIKAFNKAGGRVIGGLVRRRAEEVKLCLEGVKEG
jgi:lysozyme